MNLKFVVYKLLDLIIYFISAWILLPFTSLSWKRNNKNINSPGNNKKILLIPYDTSANILQHRILAKYLISNHVDARLLLPKKISKLLKRELKYSTTKNTQPALRNLAESLEQILQLANSDYHLERGLVDQFIRTCTISDLISEGIFWDLNKSNYQDTIKFAERLMNDFDGVVLADSAYLTNRAILSNALNSSKSAWFLNPEGQWLAASKSSAESSKYFSLEQLDELLIDYPEIADSAEKYVNSRFLGESTSDLDSALAFGKITTKITEFPRKKILFLHIFRDGPQPELRREEIVASFNSYFEWADTALKFVSANIDEWYIKPHPSLKHYPDELEILHFLLNKHGINQEILNFEITTSYILKHKFPIYTYGGTIAIESAIHGYKSHVMSVNFDSWMAECDRTIEEMESSYNLSSEESALEDVNPKYIPKAKILLFTNFFRNAEILSPVIAQIDKTTKQSWYLSSSVQVLDLAKKLVKPDFSQKVHTLFTNYIQDINSKYIE